jgi:hypothetical protein
MPKWGNRAASRLVIQFVITRLKAATQRLRNRMRRIGASKSATSEITNTTIFMALLPSSQSLVHSSLPVDNSTALLKGAGYLNPARTLNHCRFGALGKSVLNQPRRWISQSGEHLVGTRESKNVVPDLIFVSIPFDRESRFSALLHVPPMWPRQSQNRFSASSTT